MTVTREEEIVLLYTLYSCGRKPSANRAIDFILMNNLLRERNNDEVAVTNGESRIRNKIRWIRQNLKDKSQLEMPAYGVWQITQVGVDRLERAALLTMDTDLNDLFTWERFSHEFQECLSAFGTSVKDKKTA